jgi:hypothetical protein
LRRTVRREETTAIDHSGARDQGEQFRGVLLAVMARLDTLVCAFEICLNAQLLKGIGDGLLQYALLVYCVG